MRTDAEIVEWDYREQPDWHAINAAINCVFDGSRRPWLTLVADTGSDQYALVVSTRILTPAEAQSVYEACQPAGQQGVDSESDGS